MSNKRYAMVKDGKVLTSIVTGKGGIEVMRTKYTDVTECVLIDPDDGTLGPYEVENALGERSTWNGVKFTAPDMTKKTPKEAAKAALEAKPDTYQPTMKELKDAGVL